LLQYFVAPLEGNHSEKFFFLRSHLLSFRNFCFITKKTSARMKQEACLAIDLESTGKFIIAIGVFFIGSDKKTRKRCFCRSIPEKEEDFDPNTLLWWKDKQTLLTRIYKKAKKDGTLTEAAMTKTFCSFLDSLEEKEQSITILSDNEKFDLAEISQLLLKHCGRHPIWFTSKKIYRGSSNPCSRLEMIPESLKEEAKKYVTNSEKENKKVVHDHWPANDAHCIYLDYEVSKLLQKAILQSEKQIQLSLKTIVKSTAYVDQIRISS
jgi:hypothetical protein